MLNWDALSMTGTASRLQVSLDVSSKRVQCIPWTPRIAHRCWTGTTGLIPTHGQLVRTIKAGRPERPEVNGPDRPEVNGPERPEVNGPERLEASGPEKLRYRKQVS